MKNLRCLICSQRLTSTNNYLSRNIIGRDLKCSNIDLVIGIKSPNIITDYDYDQIIDKIQYRVLGHREENYTRIYDLKNNRILDVKFQDFSNQKEWRELLSKLLKLKAFS